MRKGGGGLHLSSLVSRQESFAGALNEALDSEVHVVGDFHVQARKLVTDPLVRVVYEGGGDGASAGAVEARHLDKLLFDVARTGVAVKGVAAAAAAATPLPCR